MKFQAKIITIVMLFIMMSPFIGQTHASANYEVGTSFTLDIEVKLDGGTNWYQGYTEREDETRKYEIINVVGDRVTWEMERNYRLDASESQYDESDYNTYEFYSSASTREYLNGSNDGATDANYYNYDQIWFRIHPGEIHNIGDQIKILGFDYTYEGYEDIRISPMVGISAMKFTIEDQAYQVQNTDYDPDDLVLDVIYSETFYFHPDNGFLLKSKWEAKGITDNLGSFEWEQDIVLTQSSFPVENDWNALYNSYLGIIITLIVIIGSIAAILVFLYLYWRLQVIKALEQITGKRSIQKLDYGDGPSIFDPDSFTYKYLLDTQNAKAGQRLALKDGLYIIIETDNRLVLADTTSERKYGTDILEQSDENLRLFYRLALGLVDANSNEARFFDNIPSISNHYQKVDAERIGFIDKTAYYLYMNHTTEDPLYEEIATLLSRRKVLDYSHGQAPLSPQSHLKKFRLIERFHPEEVLLVGDDDLISITLARHNIRVELIEIDPYTCALIEGIARAENLPISITQMDLRDPLPSKFRDRFDLFVADPDFSVASIALFVSRGLAAIRAEGQGLINFENTFPQRFRAKFLLDTLKAEIVEEVDESWRYSIVKNKKVAVGTYRSGKYTKVKYADDLVLAEASYSSKTYIIKKKPETVIPLSANQAMMGDPTSIYDW